ncbi:MAG: hypothetical protein ACKPKO_16885, partial [Candidatus Fonsibacter sp.]
MVGSSQRRCKGLQRETRKSQHADDAEGRGEKKNQEEVKTQLESMRKTDNPKSQIDQGDKVRVIVKNSRRATCRTGATM